MQAATGVDSGPSQSTDGCGLNTIAYVKIDDLDN